MKNLNNKGNDQGSVDSEKSKIFNLLNTIKFFKDRNIQGDDLHILAQGLTFEEMAVDEFVFKAGSLGDKFYIILKGSVRILIPIKDKTVKDKRQSLFDKTEINNKPAPKNASSNYGGKADSVSFIINCLIYSLLINRLD